MQERNTMMLPILTILVPLLFASLSEPVILTGAISGALISLVTVLGLSNRYIFRPAREGWRYVKNLQHSVESMAKELRPNGGDSLRDVLDRVEGGIVLLDQRWLGAWNLASIGMVETNSAGFIVFVSRSFTAWTGRSTDDLMGSGWIAMIHHEDRERVIAAWEQAVKHRCYYDNRHRYTDMANTVSIPVHATGHPMFGRDDKYLGHIILVYREDAPGAKLSRYFDKV